MRLKRIGRLVWTNRSEGTQSDKRGPEAVQFDQISTESSVCPLWRHRPVKKYYARICWNSKGWMFPTGEAANLERNTHARENGFGYEEWLFRFEWIFKGYHDSWLYPC